MGYTEYRKYIERLQSSIERDGFTLPHVDGGKDSIEQDILPLNMFLEFNDKLAMSGSTKVYQSVYGKTKMGALREKFLEEYKSTQLKAEEELLQQPEDAGVVSKQIISDFNMKHAQLYVRYRNEQQAIGNYVSPLFGDRPTLALEYDDEESVEELSVDEDFDIDFEDALGLEFESSQSEEELSDSEEVDLEYDFESDDLDLEDLDLGDFDIDFEESLLLELESAEAEGSESNELIIDDFDEEEEVDLDSEGFDYDFEAELGDLLAVDIEDGEFVDSSDPYAGIDDEEDYEEVEIIDDIEELFDDEYEEEVLDEESVNDPFAGIDEEDAEEEVIDDPYAGIDDEEDYEEEVVIDDPYEGIDEEDYEEEEIIDDESVNDPYAGIDDEEDIFDGTEVNILSDNIWGNEDSKPEEVNVSAKEQPKQNNPHSTPNSIANKLVGVYNKVLFKRD